MPQFWELPESPEDVFSLFSASDIRRTRDRALENLETLILAVSSRLFILRHHPSFPDPELAPDRDALNCIRVLTRILPYIYESEALQQWEERFFWGARRKRTRWSAVANEVLFDGGREGEGEGDGDGDGDGEGDVDGDGGGRTPRERVDEFEDARPLAEELVDTLVELMFFSGLTLPQVQNGKPKVTYAIWQSGVGCNTSVATTKEFESNRIEILRLLLTMVGKSMYMTPGVLPQRGVRVLTHLCTCSDKQVVLSVLCSLLNTVSSGDVNLTCVGRALLMRNRRSNSTPRPGESRIAPWGSRTPSRSLRPTPSSSHSPSSSTQYRKMRGTCRTGTTTATT